MTFLRVAHFTIYNVCERFALRRVVAPLISVGRLFLDLNAVVLKQGSPRTSDVNMNVAGLNISGHAELLSYPSPGDDLWV